MACSYYLYITHNDKEVGKTVRQRTDVQNLQCKGWPSDSLSFDNMQQLCDLLKEEPHGDFGIVFSFASYWLW